MNNKLICDKCKREIKLKQKHTKIVKIENDIERMYFKCHHCNTKYTISYTDDEFRKNINTLNVIRVKLADKSISVEAASELVKEYDTLMAKNKLISQGYRKKYESVV
ncbi:hypothetical protein NBE98_09680 [Clostridium swellfunianum]|uniref:hypothetical protein n=1 Tax=Clostridium swellfunianum TaxID=1367462 RepID=UPI0020302013|nr:hypothetical protein [Clostridium swellfunianum]MCM0648643.1 hypothetical protein [Clostridium swellfunianum]